MKYPNKLEKNNAIKIVAPSNGVTNKKMKKYDCALEYLKKNGFKVVEGSHVRNSINGVSAPANQRANEFNKALLDTNVKAIVACSGGDYVNQILDFIDFKKVVKNKKWIQGHSDITSILFYITTKYDVATIYSFNAKTFGDERLPESMKNNCIGFITGNNPIQSEYGFILSDEKIKKPWKCITCDKNIQGRIIGGCLDSLKDIIGTKYDNVKKFINKYKNDGIIWYFDVAEMTNESISRTLWQLKQAGWFKNCKGILFGRIRDEITYTNTSLIDAIKYNLEELDIPIIINADIGHTDPVITIINGSKVKITKNKKYSVETIFE